MQYQHLPFSLYYAFSQVLLPHTGSIAVSSATYSFKYFPNCFEVVKLKLFNTQETTTHYQGLSSVVTSEKKQISQTEAPHRHQVFVLINTHLLTDIHRNTHSHFLPLHIMLFQIGEISWHLSCWVRLCLLMTRLAAITGIHGVSSSEWFPISQSVPGNKKLSLGVIAFSWNSKDPKSTRVP